MPMQYTTAKGVQQWMPSLEEVQEMDENMEGFCLACNNVQSGCEPDSRNYECEACGKRKVFGAAELVLMGLVY